MLFEAQSSSVILQLCALRLVPLAYHQLHRREPQLPILGDIPSHRRRRPTQSVGWSRSRIQNRFGSTSSADESLTSAHPAADASGPALQQKRVEGPERWIYGMLLSVVVPAGPVSRSSSSQKYATHRHSQGRKASRRSHGVLNLKRQEQRPGRQGYECPPLLQQSAYCNFLGRS